MLADRSLLSPDQLQQEVAERADTVATFVATWCPYSASFMRRLPALDPQKRTLLVNVSDKEDPAWDRYRVRVLPTAVRFERDVEVDRVDGVALLGLSDSRFRQILGQ